jgi:orotidine-5'-phosphate decarboxylase
MRKPSVSYSAELSFLAKLSAAQRAHDSILCIGLDPEPASIPASLGRGPQAAVRFLRKIIRATSPHVCAYKPNLAFFERYGTAAMDVLALTLQAIPAEIPVILDAKRGDVPNTSAAYADALFGSFRADAATVAPYVGLDSITPFTTAGRYAFVLARTSNPGAGDFQDLEVAGRPLYERVVERCVDRFPADRCGFVVGATYPDEARRLRALAPDRLFLMPGVGSQGGDVGVGLRAALDANGGGVLPSASRSVLYASAGDDFEKAAASAARQLRDAANDVRSAAMAQGR